MPDHVHMMISIPPKYAVSQVIGYSKGKSAMGASETLAPGSSDAATSRSFSSCDHRRRRSTDVITSAPRNCHSASPRITPRTCSDRVRQTRRPSMEGYPASRRKPPLPRVVGEVKHAPERTRGNALVHVLTGRRLLGLPAFDRTLIRYFGSKDGLRQAAAEQIGENVHVRRAVCEEIQNLATFQASLDQIEQPLNVRANRARSDPDYECGSPQ